MSIYGALIHKNSTVKHIYNNYVFLLHRASSLAIMYGSGSHQSPPGTYKTQLYPPLLVCEKTHPPILSHLPPPQTLLMEGPGQGQPCTPMGLWTLQDPAGEGRRRTQREEGSWQVKCSSPMMLQEYPESRMSHLFEEVGRSWICREGWFGLKYIMHVHIFKVFLRSICGVFARPLQKKRNGCNFGSLKTMLVVCTSSASACLYLMLKFSVESPLLVNVLEIWENMGFFSPLKLVGKHTTEHPGLRKRRLSLLRCGTNRERCLPNHHHIQGQPILWRLRRHRERLC